jgi:diguanylate cyclase (GGDEF)-like protein
MMSTTWWIPGNVVMLLGAAMAMVLAVLSSRRPVPGRGWFALMMLAIAECEGLWAIENLSSGMAAKVRIGKLEYLGLSTAALLAYLFVRTYTGRRRLPLGAALMLWLVPAVTFALAMTNEQHQLIWSHIAPSSSDPKAPLIYTLGPAARALVVYNYGLMLWAVWTAVRWAASAHRTYRRQAGVMAAGIMLPIVCSALYLLRWAPPAWIALLPMAFTASGALVYLAIFRFHFLDLMPEARATLVENMPDGVLVLDGRTRIVDSNPAARRLFSEQDSRMDGEEACDVLGSLPQICAALDEHVAAAFDMLSPQDDRVHLEVQVVPLRSRRVDGGTLLIFRDVSEKWRAEEELRTQLSQNLELQEKLREEVLRDSLTGAFNRRMLQDALEREIASAQREGTSLALVVIDLDHFKDVNDHHGHQAGDRMLQEVARLLQAGSRASDVVCRYGGEEFVLVMPRASLDDARRRADQWRRDLESLAVAYELAVIRITMSVGVSTYPSCGECAEELLRTADRALFEAKREGRNRVCAAPMRRPLLSKTSPASDRRDTQSGRS